MDVDRAEAPADPPQHPASVAQQAADDDNQQLAERRAAGANAGSNAGGNAAAAPAQTGKRLLLLQEAFDKAVGYGLRDPSREDFAYTFHGLEPDMLDALYDTYLQTLALVRSYCQAEFQEVCTEHGVVRHLTDLDAADAEAEPPSVAVAPGAEETGAAARQQAGGTAAVAQAEAAARMHALRQEAAHLEDMLERARTTEARLTEALALRQGAVDGMAATYHRVISDVQQVYDITRVWPGVPRMKGTAA